MLEAKEGHYVGGASNYAHIDSNGNITQNGSGRTHESLKYKLTSIGGFAIKITNQTDAISVAGKVVECDHGANDAVELSEANGDHPIGVLLDSGIANGSEVWIVVAGVADVLYEDTESSARGNWVYMSGTAGFAIDAVPTPGHAADHWKEIGHCCETVTYVDTPILARCVLHFN
jgi:hypothetical protein